MKKALFSSFIVLATLTSGVAQAEFTYTVSAKGRTNTSSPYLFQEFTESSEDALARGYAGVEHVPSPSFLAEASLTHVYSTTQTRDGGSPSATAFMRGNVIELNNLEAISGGADSVSLMFNFYGLAAAITNNKGGRFAQGAADVDLRVSLDTVGDTAEARGSLQSYTSSRSGSLRELTLSGFIADLYLDDDNQDFFVSLALDVTTDSPYVAFDLHSHTFSTKFGSGGFGDAHGLLSVPDNFSQFITTMDGTPITSLGVDVHVPTASEVPVPAAAWMFMSALLGLVHKARSVRD